MARYYNIDLQDDGQDTSAPVQAPEDLPENEMAEASSAMGEIDQHINDSDDLVASADAATDMADEMNASADANEGMDEHAIAAIETAVEHMFSKVRGIKRAAPLRISRESHRSKNTRVRATREAADGIMARVKKIIQMVIDAWNKAVDVVKKFFKNIFGTAEKLKRKAEAIKEKASNLGEKSIPSDAKVNADSFGKLIRTGGKVPAPAALLDGITKMGLRGDQIVPGMDTVEVIKAGTQLSAAIEVIDNKQAFLGKMNEMVKVQRTILKHGKVTTNKKYNLPEGMELREATLGLGDKSVFSISSTKDSMEEAELSKVAGAMRIEIGMSTGAADVDKFGEVGAIDMNTVIKIAEAAIKKLEAIIDSDSTTVKSFDSAAKGITDAAKAASNKGTDDASKKIVSDNITIATKAAHAMQATMTNMYAKGKEYEVSVCKGALDYCAASLSTAKAPESK